jgi:trans-aconitate methyltransferase
MTTQTWNADDYARNAGFVPTLGSALLELITTRAPARVLDLGCGDGVLTKQLGERGYDVLGVDASEAMVVAARARGIAARCEDGHTLPFEEEFDAVFTNATLHWLTRPDEAIAGVRRALRPHGEFVGEFGGAGNLATLVRALVAGLETRGIDGAACVPWYFPTAAEYATRLEQGGFHVDFIAHFARPTPLPGDVLDWIATFGESFTRAVPKAEREAYLHEVREAVLGPLRDASGRFTLDYVRLRFRATKR